MHYYTVCIQQYKSTMNVHTHSFIIIKEIIGGNKKIN
jgi:hypothetical protein